MDYVHKATFFGSGVIYERFYPRPRRSLHHWVNLGSDPEWLEKDVKDPGNAFKTSLYRTKRAVRFLCLSNKWDWFVTLTIDKDKCERYSSDGLKKMLGRFTAYLRKNGCKYVFVPEPHEDGAWHLHGFVKGPLDVSPAVNKKNGGAVFTKRRERVYVVPYWASLVGYTEAIKVSESNPVNVTKYVTKYITKSLLDSKKWGFGKKRYWASKGLNHPVEKEYLNLFGHPKEGVDGWKKCKDYDVWFRWLVPGSDEYAAFMASNAYVVKETPPDFLFESEGL